jgi:molecular chaperone GrpE
VRVSPIEKVERQPAVRETLRRRRRLLALRRAFRETRQPAGPDPDYVAQVEGKARVLAEENAGLRDAVARQRAEFDNFRKRTAKEKEQTRAAASEAILGRLLPVIDNFDRALASSAQATDPTSIRTGIEMVASQLHSILGDEGLEKIHPAGEPFDPTVHEAVAVEERVDVPDHHVSEVMLPGFRYKDRVIRPAMVKVARNAAKEASEPAAPKNKGE